MKRRRSSSDAMQREGFGARHSLNSLSGVKPILRGYYCPAKKAKQYTHNQEPKSFLRRVYARSLEKKAVVNSLGRKYVFNESFFKRYILSCCAILYFAVLRAVSCAKEKIPIFNECPLIYLITHPSHSHSHTLVHVYIHTISYSHCFHNMTSASWLEILSFPFKRLSLLSFNAERTHMYA